MLFAVGDVHGCAVELRMLLNELPLTPDATVVFLGDYIDRGPDSKGVVDTVLELSQHCQVVALMGNHEEMLLAFLENPRSHRGGMFILNGGGATLQSYATGGGGYEIPQSHRDFFENLRTSYETEHDFFVHAGVPSIPLSEIDPDVHGHKMLWTRKPFLTSAYRWSKMIVHGHTVVEAVDIRKNRINVDTGCVFRRRLSAIALPGHRVISVPKVPGFEPVVLRDESSRRAAVRFQGALPVRVTVTGRTFEFETVDYSELGLYIHGVHADNFKLEVGDSIHGEIGPNDPSCVVFSGRIVRVKEEDTGTHYAVQVNHIDASGE